MAALPTDFANLGKTAEVWGSGLPLEGWFLKFYDLHLGYISPIVIDDYQVSTTAQIHLRPSMNAMSSLPFLTSISKHPYVVLPWIGTGGWLQEVLGGRWLCRQLSRGKASGDWCQICQKHSESHRCHDFLSPMLAGKFFCDWHTRSCNETIFTTMHVALLYQQILPVQHIGESAKLLDGRLTCWTQCTEGHLIVICWMLALYKLAGKYQGYNLLRVWG